MRFRRDLLLGLSLLAAAASAHGLHVLSLKKAGPAEELPFYYLPSGRALRLFSLGQHTTLADLHFLRFVQYVGTDKAQDARWPQIEPLIQLVTDLDPKYGYAYEVGGVLLIAAQRTDESDRVLAKGIEHVPGRWQLPFFAAYNQWYERRDFRKGGELLLKASQLPGRPQWLLELAARLHSQAGSFEPALRFIEAALAQEPPEALRKDLVSRRTELLVERDLQLLEDAIARFEKSVGDKPLALGELVGPVLTRLPTAPDGSDYTYNPVTGEVGSPLLPKRLEVYFPKDEMPAIQAEQIE